MEIIIENFPNNKASGGATPLNIFKQFCFTHQIGIFLTKWGIFPDSFKFEIITSAQQKDEATDKENYIPVSALPLLSIIFEKVICDQCIQYPQIYQDSLLCSFWKAHFSEHALFNLLQAW